MGVCAPQNSWYTSSLSPAAVKSEMEKKATTIARRPVAGLGVERAEEDEEEVRDEAEKCVGIAGGMLREAPRMETRGWVEMMEGELRR